MCDSDSFEEGQTIQRAVFGVMSSERDLQDKLSEPQNPARR